MNNKNTFHGLGAREARFVSQLSYEKKTIVSAQEIGGFLPARFKYRNQFVYNLKRKKILTSIKRGYYIFTPLESIASGARVNEFLIPSVFFPNKNYYIGYSNMFNYYGFTDQLFQTVYVVNSSLCKRKEICGVSYQFVKVTKNRMYGIETIKIAESNVKISSKERTLIDLIYFNKSVGGISQAVEILKKIILEKKCDVKKLIQYAVLFPNVTVRKQIGVVLETLGITMALLRPLAKSVERSAISSFTESKRGQLNKKWRVIINASSK